MFFDTRVLTGKHKFQLPENETVEIEITRKGLDWQGIATWRDSGDIKNTVQCNYRYEFTTMYDLVDDMICLVTFGTSNGIDADYIIED